MSLITTADAAMASLMHDVRLKQLDREGKLFTKEDLIALIMRLKRMPATTVVGFRDMTYAQPSDWNCLRRQA